MKISIRMLLALLPVVAICALLVGMAVLRPTQTHAAGTVAHALHPNAIPAKITASDVDLYQCDNGPQSNCSVLTQLNENDTVQVICQIPGWSYVDAPDYGDKGWVSNDYISAVSHAPTCSKH